MDFIERVFHIAPDGGTGTLEFAFLLVLIVVPLATLAWFQKRRIRDRV